MNFLALLQNFTLPSPLRDAVLLLARIIFGVTFFYYGQFKLRDLKQNARDFEEVHGLKPGWLWGTLVGFLESFGSIAVALGVFVPLTALGFVVHMASGATWKITRTDKPFTDWSYDLLLLSIALMLLVAGPGAYALDFF